MKLFVWDFHGTLEKGNEFAATEISNIVLQQLEFSQKFRKEDATRLYGRKWYEYFEYLLPSESHETHVLLQQTCFELPKAEAIVAKHMQPNDHVQEVLGKIHDSGHAQIVVSNTSLKALPIFLKLAGITEFFDGTAFAVTAHSREVKRSKVDVVQEYLSELKTTPEIISIGDSVTDMDLAEYFNGKGYWYRHPGQATPEILQTHKNLTAINDLREVLVELL